MHISIIKKDQCLQQLLLAGSSLYVKSGSLRMVAAPQFLEGFAWQTDVVLSEGMGHVVERDGWVQLHGLHASEMLIQPAQQSQVVHSLTRLWHGLAGLLLKQNRVAQNRQSSPDKVSVEKFF